MRSFMAFFVFGSGSVCKNGVNDEGRADKNPEQDAPCIDRPHAANSQEGGKNAVLCPGYAQHDKGQRDQDNSNN